MSEAGPVPREGGGRPERPAAAPRGDEPEGGAGRVLDLLLPGLRPLLRGRRGGLPVLGPWCFLWALVALRWERVAATLPGGAPDEWLALSTVVAGLAACLWAGWRLPSAAPGTPRGGPGEVAGEGAGPPAGEPAGTSVAEGTDRGGEGPGIDGEGPGTAAAVARPGATAGPLPWRRFLRHRQAATGLVLLAALVLAALLTPYLAPYDPGMGQSIVETRYLAPSAAHPMGTDRFGRDVFTRVLYGARISLGIGVTAVVIAITLGTLVGAVAGYLGGWSDTLAMRGVDMLLSFPRLVLLITLVALFEPSIALVTLVLGLTGWMGTSRIVRGEVLSLREQEFVQAARALGYGDGRILLRHVLPNALSPVIVAATLGVGNTILAEAALSFLGLGVQAPTPSWGNMVSAGRDVMVDAWWITLFPGLAIVATVMSFNLVGDGLRDALDPRHEGVS